MQKSMRWRWMRVQEKGKTPGREVRKEGTKERKDACDAWVQTEE